MISLRTELTNRLRIFTGATNTSSGSIGIIPQPNAGDNTKFLRGDGTWDIASGSSFTVVPTITNNFTASVNTEIPCDVTINSITITFPNTVSHGDKIRVIHISGNIVSNPVTINPNGISINGSTSPILINFTGAVFEVTYYAPLNEWIITYSSY
ncbi:MAG: hypothetical protein ABIK31_07230 [candidate division WOR-3 bacterium]